MLALYVEGVSARDTVRFISYGQGLGEVPTVSRNRITTMESYLSRLPAAGRTTIEAAWSKAKRDMRSHGPVIIITSAEADPTLPGVVSNAMARGHPVTVVSPQPLDAVMAMERGARWTAREANLEQLRQLGAMVFSWGADAALAVDRPVDQVVLA